MKTLLLDCNSLQFWNQIGQESEGITALQSISMWKTGCLSYSWMHASNKNYESWKASGGPLDTAIWSLRVNALPCVATVNSCNFFQL